jgi:hypothetical protein
MELAPGELTILKIDSEHRRFFRGINQEIHRISSLNASSISLKKDHRIGVGPLPLMTLLGLQSFPNSSQLLYQLLNLEETICLLGETHGALCPYCRTRAETLSPDEIAISIIERYSDRQIIITTPLTAPHHDIRQRCSAVIIERTRWDSLDIPDSLWSSANWIGAVLFEGKASPSKRGQFSSLISLMHELGGLFIEIRSCDANFPALRYYGSNPTCPSCGKSTLPLNPARLCLLAKEHSHESSSCELEWYPEVLNLLSKSPKELLNFSLPASPHITESLTLLAEFEVKGNLASRVSDLPLSERLCLRFLAISPHRGSLLAIEIPDYGLSTPQSVTLKKWLDKESLKGQTIVMLGGEKTLDIGPENSVSTAAISITATDSSYDSLSHPNSPFFSLAPGEIMALPVSASETILKVSEDSIEDSDSWKKIDLVHSLLDKTPSIHPFFISLSIFKAFTNLYAQTTAAKAMGIGARELSLFGAKSHRCEHCAGHGQLHEEHLTITCPRCSGTRFKHHIEQLTFRGVPYPALFNENPQALLSYFGSIVPIQKGCAELCSVGLGDTPVGTPERELPKEDRLRYILLKECSSLPRSSSVIIRGLGGILNVNELDGVIEYLSSSAANRSHRIIHDGFADPRGLKAGYVKDV